jgi:O-antigen/teichoic acid export membrane protein
MLGAESFGLLGFYSAFYSWLIIFDMGLSPAMLREAAISKNSESKLYSFSNILKICECLLVSSGFIIFLSVFFLSPFIASKWLKASHLDFSTIKLSIIIMGLIIPIRIFGSFYRGSITGIDDQTWLNTVSIVFNILRFLASYVCLKTISSNIKIFFMCQAMFFFLETLVLKNRIYKKLNINYSVSNAKHVDWSELKRIIPFASNIIYLTALWTLSTQIDKTILSGSLKLSEFGYFTLAASITGAISCLTLPIIQSILPQITSLVAEGNIKKIQSLYLKTNTHLCIISFTTAFVIGCFGQDIIYAWTGNKYAAVWSGPLLLWLALSNSFVALNSSVYYIQNAFGKLKYHVWFSTLFGILQAPIVYFSVKRFGAVGAASSCAVFNAIGFIFWSIIVHRLFLPDINNLFLLLRSAVFFTISIMLVQISKRIVLIPIETSPLIVISKVMLIGMMVLGGTYLLRAFIKACMLKSPYNLFYLRNIMLEKA